MVVEYGELVPKTSAWDSSGVMVAKGEKHSISSIAKWTLIALLADAEKNTSLLAKQSASLGAVIVMVGGSHGRTTTLRVRVWLAPFVSTTLPSKLYEVSRARTLPAARMSREVLTG